MYCLSGLGADRKAFQYIRLNHVELIHIEWIDPLPNESLESYAKRLFDITIQDTEYFLMGLSFGGMLAQEFAKIRKPKQLFLISTINSATQLPRLFQIFGSCKFHYLLPNSLIKSVNGITRYFFGTQDERVDKIFREIQSETNPTYIKWAMTAILNWQNTQHIEAIRIHGDKDKLLPLPFKVDHIIQGGGHLMLIDHGEEVSTLIESHLER